MADRMYSEAWETLKTLSIEGKPLKIAAHNKLHARIFKAIQKERDVDLIYKLELEEKCCRGKMVRFSKAGELKIYLQFSIGLDDFPDADSNTNI